MKFYTRQRKTPQVIIVSLIDILAILLIFVIVTTTFKRPQPQVVIKLPESKSAESTGASTPNLATIFVAKDGQIHVNDKLVPSADALVPMLKTFANDNRPVSLEADTEAPFGLMFKIFDAFKAAGIQDIPAFAERPSS